VKKQLMKIYVMILAVIFVLTSLAACTNTEKETEDESNLSTVSETSDISETSKTAEEMHKRSESDSNKDEEIITEEQKHGIIEEGLLGVAGTKVTTYEGFLGYGYNLLEAAYYNQEDIKATNPVIDMDALASAGYVYMNVNTANSVNASHFISNTTKEYSSEISASASLKGKVGLTGSFKASFSMDYTSEIKSNQKLITTQSKLYTQRDFLYGASDSVLSGFATETFKEDVKNKTVAKVFEKYGTHILKDIYLGGRFELNYIYTNSSNKSTEDIKASVSASNGWVSGDSSASTSTKRKEVVENSQTYVRAYGGAVTVDPTSIDKAQESYAEWAKGVEEGKSSFVDCTEIIPLWDIIASMDIEDAESKADEYEKYFDSKSDQIASEFKASVSVKTYIGSLYVGTGDSIMKAKNALRQNGVLEGNIINIDLNKGAGGDFIYVGYKTTTDESKAIRGIVADYWKDSHSTNITYNNHSYKIIPTDLNRGSGGKFIYLYYTTDKNAGEPITGIQYQDNNTFQYKNADNYEVVRCTTTGDGMDLNMSVGGDFIYLWFTRK